MLSVFLLVLPIFGLIGVGFLARFAGLLNDRTGEGLSDFVYALAIPCLIFRTLAKATLPEVQPWGYWLAYFGGVAVVWVLATVISRRFFGVMEMEGAVAGFSAAQSNTVLVGIPLILEAYGQEGAVPLFLLIAVHLPIMMTVATILVEGRGTSPLTIARRLITHPIVIAVMAGSLARMVPGGLPQVAWALIEPIAEAAVPCALIAMGIALRRYGFGEGIGLVSSITVLKLLVHPFIVYVLALHVFRIPPTWAGVAVLFAASPSGINAYLLAERYKCGIAIASGSIAMSTGFALASTMFWLMVLGAG